MQPSVTFFGPLDTILGSPTVGGALLIEYVIFGVVIVNFLTRQLATEATSNSTKTMARTQSAATRHTRSPTLYWSCCRFST